MSRSLLPMFSASFMISDIIFKSLSLNSKLHIELIFVYCVRQFVCMYKEKLLKKKWALGKEG